jgi:CubicO group peptidase (beta-lactamase class C family)
MAEGLQERLHLGAQIYVSRNGATLLDEAFGEARDGAPMRTDSILAWFSAGKPVTAVAIAQLAERGRLNWETPVAEIIPEFGQGGKEAITLRHLLTHTAGLRRADDVDDSLSWDEKIAWISSLEADPEWTPGARAGYQSSGTWYVLGEVVRRLSGTAVDEFARVNIFSPAGMKNSSLALRPEEIRTFGDRIAFVYDTSGENPQPKQEWNSNEGMMRCRPGGSARGPIRELGKISERRQIAERFLSEGNGEAARIRGNRVRDLNKIQSEAYRQVEEIRGVADAKATEIYAKAYNQSPEAVAFYEFTRIMQAYKSMIGKDTTLVLSTDSDLFKFLKAMTPGGVLAPPPAAGEIR